MDDVLEINFQLLPNTTRYAPYVPISVIGDHCKSKVFEMRVDTGADITILPEEMLEGMSFRTSSKGSVRIMNITGKVARAVCKEATINIHGDSIWSFTPPDGVLIKDHPQYGLLGMDVLGHMVLHMENEKLTLIRKRRVAMGLLTLRERFCRQHIRLAWQMAKNKREAQRREEHYNFVNRRRILP